MGSLTFSIEHDLPSAKEKFALLRPRLITGMTEGTRRGTNIIAGYLEEVTAARTTMDRGMIRSMVYEEFGPFPGGIARGTVGFKPPPAYFYPKVSKALVFRIGGRTIFAKRVRGSRPYKLVPRALNFSVADVDDAFQDELRKAVG